MWILRSKPCFHSVLGFCLGPEMTVLIQRTTDHRKLFFFSLQAKERAKAMLIKKAISSRTVIKC